MANTTNKNSVDQVMADSKKEFGDDVGELSGDYFDVVRVPTGILELDIAMGGGFPKRRLSIVYGNESSTKTVTAVLAIANHQKLWPDKKCAFIGIEGIDKPWFKMLGVDIEKVAWFQPAFAEQVVDIIESLCYAEDIGVIVLDSIAAMMTTVEYEKSATKSTVGGAGIPISKMVRKTTAALAKSKGEPTLIFINQIRHKIGVMYGSTEKMPGGDALLFQSGMTLRLYGKNEMDTKYSKVMPVKKNVIATIKKWKVPIIAVKATYDLVMIPHKGLVVGQSDYFNSFVQYGKELGMIEPGKKGVWGVAFGQEFSKMADLKDLLYSDPNFSLALKKDLVDALHNDGSIINAQES